MTRNPLQPISRHCGSTTERGSSGAPMRQVPLACWASEHSANIQSSSASAENGSSIERPVMPYSTRVEYGTTGRSIEDELTGAALDDWMFAECSDAQHASGTCRMGAANDPRSVVDPECRVIGVSGLRVIDASVMPTVVRANTHFTTVMTAEKMADVLKR